MSPAPQRGTPSGDAFLALSKLARDTGQDSQDVFTMYALEGLLARLAASAYRDDFVLKGGVLWSSRRRWSRWCSEPKLTRGGVTSATSSSWNGCTALTL